MAIAIYVADERGFEKQYSECLAFKIARSLNDDCAARMDPALVSDSTDKIVVGVALQRQVGDGTLAPISDVYEQCTLFAEAILYYTPKVAILDCAFHGKDNAVFEVLEKMKASKPQVLKTIREVVIMTKQSDLSHCRSELARVLPECPGIVVSAIGRGSRNIVINHVLAHITPSS